MDGAGVKIAVLSMMGSGVPIERDTQLAIKRARQANDALAAETARRPDRYAGFANLAMQDVKAGIAELQRCVRELGFKGAMINHQTTGIYLDDPRYEPFWEAIRDPTSRSISTPTMPMKSRMCCAAARSSTKQPGSGRPRARRTR